MIVDILQEAAVSDELKKKFEELEHIISNTPIIELQYTYKGKSGKIYIKYEHANLTGSIKDRMALFILKKAYENGEITPGDHIVETTSGNAGISFAAIGSALGHPVKIMMPDWMCQERIGKMREMGAIVDLISEEEGGIESGIKIAELLAEKGSNVFLPNQFKNIANPEAYQSTIAPEIWKQLKAKNINPHVFVAELGTGGTVMGIGRFLKDKDSAVKIHPVNVMETAVLNYSNDNKQQTIAGLTGKFVNLEELDEFISVSDIDAASMAQKLSLELGIEVGISSGANILGAIKLQQSLGETVNIVTVFSDSCNKQINNSLMEEKAFESTNLSSDINLINYQIIG